MYTRYIYLKGYNSKCKTFIQMLTMYIIRRNMKMFYVNKV